MNDLPDQITSKLEVRGECWEWTGATNGRGRYGHLKWGGKNHPAHRLVYELVRGPVPSELDMDHLKPEGCVGTLCCNPEHLEPVTRLENIMRGRGPQILRDKTHCKNGHAYTPDNTKWFANGRRGCKTCRSLRDAKRKQVNGVRRSLTGQEPA